LAFERFDPALMAKEVHEMTEALVKIQAGTYEAEGLHFDDNVFLDSAHNQSYGDYGDEYGDDYGDEEYQAEVAVASKVKKSGVTNK
jgi:hypothetical protein